MTERVDLDAVDTLCEAATPGPWVPNDLGDTTFNSANERGWWWVWQESKLPYCGGVLEVGAGNGHSECAGSIGEAQITDAEDGDQERADAEFIAQSRTLLPSLVAELRDLRAKVDAVRVDVERTSTEEMGSYPSADVIAFCRRILAALGEVAGREDNEETTA